MNRTLPQLGLEDPPSLLELNPIAAMAYLRQEFPRERYWTCWRPGHAVGRLIAMLLGKGHQAQGRLGQWSWSRVPCTYPALEFWNGYDLNRHRGDDWAGVLRLRHPSGRQFLLFSFMGTRGEMSWNYVVSTRDYQLLLDLGRALQTEFQPPEQIRIHVHGGDDIYLADGDDETIFLPDALREDIEVQVSSFYSSASQYAALGLRHRRGFMFAGPSGTGKTMMLRHLIRQCHRQDRVNAIALSIVRDTEDNDIVALFRDAALSVPSIVILEDMDALTTTSRVSRANLLAQLDGLDAREGVLVIGTTNHPEQIDPALVHRPSRFDRVWQFQLPDPELRRRYLGWAFPKLTREAVAVVVRQTHGWSFAYLNELRTTASILALDRGGDCPCTADVTEGLGLLGSQFQAGRQNHVAPASEQLGFGGG